MTSCAHNPLESHLNQPEYYLDNSLPFQPGRIWRLVVGWTPDPHDARRALVTKKFEFIASSSAERQKLETEITDHGGEPSYLRWFESQLFPVGNWEKFNSAKITRYKHYTAVVVTTKALKSVKRSGRLSVKFVRFPDPVLRAPLEGCYAMDWDVVGAGQSVGWEVVLKSRDQDPGASRWKKIQYDSPAFSWRAWSVGQGSRIAYRMLVTAKKNFSRCPLPPKIHHQFKLIEAPQNMGIDW